MPISLVIKLSDTGLTFMVSAQSVKAFNWDYSKITANISSHHHFVCIKCEMTRDFYSEEFDQLKIPDVVKTLG